MALPAVLSSLNGLKEDVAKLYKQDGSIYILDVEPADGFELQKISALKETLSKERKRAGEFEDKLKAFGDITPEAAKQALEALKELDGKPLDKAVEERIKIREQQLTEKHSKETKVKDEKLSTVTKQLEHNMLTAAAISALAAKTKNVDLLLPHVLRQMRLREVDGKYITEIIGLDGQARITSRSNSSEAMQLSELLEEMVKSSTYAPAFDGAGGSGSGAGGGGAGGGRNDSKAISLADSDAIGANLEAIAKGKVVVVR